MSQPKIQSKLSISLFMNLEIFLYKSCLNQKEFYFRRFENKQRLLVKPGTPEHRNTGTRNTGTPEHQKTEHRNTGTLKLREMHLV